MNIRFCSLFFLLHVLMHYGLMAQQCLLRYPRDGYHTLNNPVSFYWSGTTTNTYDFELDDADTFLSPIVSLSGLANPSVNFSAWPDTGIYFWHARISGGLWSAPRLIHIVQPNAFPGLRMWLRSDTGLIMNGNTVSQWQDLSGNGNHLAQTVAALQPTRLAQSYNNRPSLSFDGNDHLITSSFPYDIDNTGFICGRKTGGSGYGTFLSAYNFNFEIQAGYCHFQTQPNQVISGYNTDTLSVIELVRQSGNSRVFADGELVGTNASALLPLQTNTMKLGYQNNSVSQLVGHINEVLFFNEALSDYTSSLLNNYLMDRYTPALFIGNDTDVVSGFCPIQLNLPSGYYFPVWNDGSNGNTLLAETTGSYWVTAYDYFGRLHSDTIHIAFPEPGVLSSQTVCAGTPLIWNTGITGLNYEWQDGSSGTSYSIEETGTYFFRAEDSQGCFYYSDTADIVVDAFSEASLGNDTLLCGGNVLQLNPQVFPGTSFLWNTGETTASVSVDTSGVYVLQAVNTNSCFVHDTISILIVGIAPQAAFSIQETCAGGVVLFTDASVPTPGETISSWEWTFSNGTADTLQNPVIIFPDTGTYTASLKVISSQGCGAIVTQSLVSFAYPIAWFAHLNACENTPVQFLENANGLNGLITTFSWNFGDPSSGSNTSGADNPTHLFSSTGIFSVQLIVTNQVGCSDTMMQSIQVKPAPEAAIQQLSFCKDSVVSLQSVSIVSFPWQINSSTWVLASDTLIGSLINLFGLAEGIYPLQLAVTSTNGCRDTLSDVLEIRAVPNPDFLVNYPCIDQYTSFTSMSTCNCVIDSLSWKINQNYIGSATSQPYSFNDTIPVAIELFVYAENGCMQSVDTILKPGVPPLSAFDIQPPFTAPGNEVTAIPSSTGDNHLIWIINGLHIPVDTLMYSFPDTGTYQVNLVMINSNGCTDTASEIISVYAPKHDLALLRAEMIVDSTSYRFLIQVANLGTVTEIQPRIAFSTDLETGISEILDFNLLPGEVRVAELQSAFTKIADNRYFICLTIQSSAMLDENIYNNEWCLELIESDGLRSGNLYPNPASEDLFWQVYSPVAHLANMQVFGTSGQLAFMKDVGLEKGINRLVIPLEKLGNGLHVIRLSAGGSTVSGQFLVLKKP